MNEKNNYPPNPSESFFWRVKKDWLKDPVCSYAEATWTFYLFESIDLKRTIEPVTEYLSLPRMHSAEATLIRRPNHKYIPTAIIIDADEPAIIGALTGIGHEKNYPLRPLRYSPEYELESETHLNLAQTLNEHGFDESDPLLNVMMVLLHQLSLPVNDALPDIVADYWPDSNIEKPKSPREKIIEGYKKVTK